MQSDRPLFSDRVEAGAALAGLLAPFRGASTMVLGIPRGGVVVAAAVARALGAPLDVLVTRKLGSPRHPEYAVGAIGENGVRIVNENAVRWSRIDPAALGAVEKAERAELARRTAIYRHGLPPLDLTGTRAIIVDDGVATGSTAVAACAAARALGAVEVVLAVPVAPSDWTLSMGEAADAYVAVSTPRDLWSVGRWYGSFEQTTDDEVIACLSR